MGSHEDDLTPGSSLSYTDRDGVIKSSERFRDIELESSPHGYFAPGTPAKNSRFSKITWPPPSLPMSVKNEIYKIRKVGIYADIGQSYPSPTTVRAVPHGMNPSKISIICAANIHNKRRKSQQ